MKPCESLEAWFDTGLVKQVSEADASARHSNHSKGKHHKASPKQKPSANVKTWVTGAKPLPAGYTGCNEQKTLIEVPQNGILAWPIRVSLHSGVCTKTPWTLYHYTHKESFEKFHAIFHDMGNLDADEFGKMLVQQMQSDYQERVPNPTNINSKGEPQLTTAEPAMFNSKDELLAAVFGKDAVTGYSKQGHPFIEFADYCIAVQVPASACFQNTNQPSTANVRICRETLEQLERRAAALALEAEQKRKKEAETEEKEEHHDREGRPKRSQGCLERLCGLRRPEKAEFWDEVETGKSAKKKDRELDRWKQRLAKKWLDEHVEECAAQTAVDFKSKDAMEKHMVEQKAKADQDKRKASRVTQTMQVNRESRSSQMSFNFGITKTLTQMVQKFTPDKQKASEEQHYRQEANKEVVAASSLFKQVQSAGAVSKQGSQQDSDHNEGKVADEHMKRMWRAELIEEKRAAPTGTKRKVIKKGQIPKGGLTDAGLKSKSKAKGEGTLGEAEKQLLEEKDKDLKKHGDRKSSEKAGEEEKTATETEKKVDGKNEKSEEEPSKDQEVDKQDPPVKKTVSLVSPTNSPPRSPKHSETSKQSESGPLEEEADKQTQGADVADGEVVKPAEDEKVGDDSPKKVVAEGKDEEDGGGDGEKKLSPTHKASDDEVQQKTSSRSDNEATKEEEK